MEGNSTGGNEENEGSEVSIEIIERFSRHPLQCNYLLILVKIPVSWFYAISHHLTPELGSSPPGGDGRDAGPQAGGNDPQGNSGCGF